MAATIQTADDECRMAWLLVMEDFTSKITDKDQLKYALQCTGRNPSNNAIEKYWNTLGGSISYSQFSSIMRREKIPSFSDLIDLFKKIDRHSSGFISLNELKRILSKRGEVLTDEEIQHIINQLPISDDKLDYNEFCHEVVDVTERSVELMKDKINAKTRIENSTRGTQTGTRSINPDSHSMPETHSSVDGYSSDLPELSSLEPSFIESETLPIKDEPPQSDVLIEPFSSIDMTSSLPQSINHMASDGCGPPHPPDNLEKWHVMAGKGCFYIDDSDGGINSHQYILKLPSKTQVWIEMKATPPGNPHIDMSLYIYHMDEKERPNGLVTFIQHKLAGNVWVCHVTLEGGAYVLLPFTTGCVLRQDEEEEEDGEKVPLVQREGERVCLSQPCKDVLKEIFHRHDLDNSNGVSRNEFDFYSERCGKEVCDDITWKAIEDNFEINDNSELTVKGFISLHEYTAGNDHGGGEGEIWKSLKSVGYNHQLQLVKACPFQFEVYTESCDGEIEILPLSSSSDCIDESLCGLAVVANMTGSVRGTDDVVTHTLAMTSMTTIVIENKSDVRCSVQVDCSRSINSLFSHESAVNIFELQPHTSKVAYHLIPQISTQPYQVLFIASIIKT
jgi:Ca2+-binding EF-hand superfamily protein